MSAARLRLQRYTAGRWLMACWPQTWLGHA